MTKNSTIKRILIMVTTILSITMFSLLAVVAVSSTVLDFHRENNISRAATTTNIYNFNTGPITKDEYYNGGIDTRFVNFAISSVNGLKNFAFSVSNGCPFEGKTVSLSNDIDCTGENIPVIGACNGKTFYERYHINSDCSFAGTFNGNNKIIKNITSKVWLEGGGSADVGFFNSCIASAKIVDLCLTNYEINFDGNRSSVNFCAPLVGTIYGDWSYYTMEIDNVCIDNFKLTFGGSERKVSWMTGLIGLVNTLDSSSSSINSEIKISNCLIQNINYPSSDRFSYGGGIYSVGPFWGNLWGNQKYNLSDCVVMDSEHSLYMPQLGEKGSNIYRPKPSQGLGNLSQEYWWQNDNYNNGRPCLKKFIEFNTIYFKVNDSNLGSVSISQIKLPKYSDLSKSEDLYISANNSNGCVYAYTSTNVIAKAIAKSGGEFKKWTYNANTYTAIFSIKTIKVTFGEFVDKPDNLTTPDTTKTYYVEYGTTIQIKLTPNFKKITFPVKDEQGNNVDVSYEITGYGWYFSDLIYNWSSMEIESDSINFKLTEDTSFLPEHNYQLYQVTFKSNANTDRNSDKNYSVEYGEELSINKQTNSVEFNLTETSDGSSHSVKYNANLGYSISGVTFSTGSASGNTYIVKSDVDINVTTQARTDTAYKVTFNIAPKVSLSDGTTTISQSTMNMYSTTTLKYLKSADLSIIIQVVDNGITYKTFVYTPSSDLSNPRLKINDETKLCGTEQKTYNISADTTITPIYSYPVTIEENALVGMTADEKIGIDYGSAVTITFSTTDIDSKSYDVVTITYYNNNQINTKTYTINDGKYIIKTVTVDGATHERAYNKSSTTNFGANNLVISITTAQKTYNAVFN